MILATPTPAANCPMVYSPATSTIVLVNTASLPGSYLSPTTSTFQWSGSSWILSNSGLINNPPPRVLGSAAFDTTGSQVVFGFGNGPDGTEYRNDLWGYNSSSAWSQLEANYNNIGLSIGTISTSVNNSTYPPTVVQSNITGTTGLTIRYSPYMFALSTGVMLWGGNSLPGINDDQYLWASGSWTTQTPANIPPLLTQAASASDGSANAVLFGGAGTDGRPMNGTYVYNTTSTTWTKLTTNQAPLSRTGASLCWYPTGSYWLMTCGARSDGLCMNDVWSLTIGGGGTTGTWTQLTLTTNITGRCNASMAFDTSSSQLILFGGQANDQSYRGDTAQWSGTGSSGTWTLLAGSPY